MDRIFAKTMLRAYRSLESVAGQIDDLVYRRALSSHSFRADCVCSGAEQQVEKIVQLMNKKSNLINLKLLTDEIMAVMDGESFVILTNKYFKNLKAEKSVEQLGISLRTYFRRLDKAEDRFAKECLLRGCGDDWFKENYFDQSWIKNLYDDEREKEQNARQ